MSDSVSLSNNDLLVSENVSILFDRLYPHLRSILGKGYRDSLEILKEYIPFETEVYKSGTKVLNWSVPKEWEIDEAYIEDESGKKVIDIKNCNLHVVNYSAPVDMVMPLSELKSHIYTSSSDRKAIPYTISYYKERWGFCMSKEQLESLPEGNYHAVIKSRFADGALVTGQTVLEGQSKKEILISTYLCHPSMANNELSGPLVQAILYQKIKAWKHRKYTYRFVINPETIGSIAYLSRYGKELLDVLKAGIVLTCLGGEEECLRIKLSKSATAPFDVLTGSVNAYLSDKEKSELKVSALFKEESLKTGPFRVKAFDPAEGSDERQYCSCGFNLPVSQISRKTYGTYKEYHTSLDTKELMGIDNVIDSAQKIEALLKMLEDEQYYKTIYPYGEVKLGDYDLYPSINCDGVKSSDNELINSDPQFVRKVMFILSYSDGTVPLSELCKKLNCPLENLKKICSVLVKKGLLKEDL